jgi:hypothetical protein
MPSILRNPEPVSGGRVLPIGRPSSPETANRLNRVGTGMSTRPDTGGRERPSRNEIARLAYQFYETHGRRDGHDVDDWLSAEQELTRHYR